MTVVQVQTLLSELPEYIRDMVVFSLCTGLRYGNVLKLEWDKVDLTNKHTWVDSINSKTRKPIAVPLNEQALAVLNKQVGKHSVRVFTRAGQPVYRANGQVWRDALKRAGITNFRWHDLRHTWASWHVQNGTRVNELQSLGGWASGRMVERYAHLSSEHLAKAASTLDSLPISYVSATLPA